ncbi:MAG TPA: TraB/GumN family protein [Flavobacteriales bacterium]|nr:TraB/GumN family protein [Flavobacteriales bacterium]
MRRISLALFFLPMVAWAQPTTKALLWKIDGPGGGSASYVVGTVHSRDARAYTQVPQLLLIMQDLDAVAGELDLVENMSGAMGALKVMMMPPGTELADLLPKRKVERVNKAVRDKLGPMAPMMARVKPFFLMAMLSETEMRTDSAMVLDQYLQVKAQEMGKDVLGVETMEEQLRAVDDLPLKDQAEMLYESVRKGFDRKVIERMMEAYAAQDLDKLAAYVNGSGMSQKVGDRLLTERNGVMATRMDSLMREGRTFLFALGAGHLPGRDGVLAQLRAMGYAVVPVEAAALRP